MPKIKYSKETLEEAVKSSYNVSEVIRRLGIKSKSGSIWKHIKNRIEFYNIDTKHFKGQRSNSGINHKGGARKKSWKEILIVRNTNSYREDSWRLRRALLEYGMNYLCAICLLEPKWQNKSLTLEIDHINGNGLDNRISNLRFLCPNCHSQTPNYGNKNKSINKCINCNSTISKKAKRCRKCASTQLKNIQRKTKIEWPSDSSLIEMINNSNNVEVAKLLGVSETTIRKRIKRIKNERQKL